MKPALEEMVGAFDEDQFSGFRQRGDERFQFPARAELIARTTDEKLWLGAVVQKIEVVHPRLFGIRGDGCNRHSDSDQRANSRIFAGGAQSYCRSERKPGKNQRKMKLRIEPIKSGSHIIHFASAIIMFALAQSRPAKIEAQDWKSEVVQRLHGMKDDLVVQRTAEQRVWMANDCRVGRVRSARVQQSFQPPRRPVNE